MQTKYTGGSQPSGSCCSKCVPRTRSSSASEILLEMQNFRPSPKPTESESTSHEDPSWFIHTGSVEKHYFWVHKKCPRTRANTGIASLPLVNGDLVGDFHTSQRLRNAPSVFILFPMFLRIPGLPVSSVCGKRFLGNTWEHGIRILVRPKIIFSINFPRDSDVYQRFWTCLRRRKDGEGMTGAPAFLFLFF